MFIIGGIGLFFSSIKIQTELANKFTQRINRSFDSNIQLTDAHIDYGGNIGISGLIIRDHKGDTLFYSPRIYIDREGINRYFLGDFNFSSVDIESPILKIIHYENEKETNLSQLLKKISQPKENKLTKGSLSTFQLSEGELVYYNTEKDITSRFSDISLSLSDLFFDQGIFETQIKDFNFSSQAYENLSKLNATLRVTSEEFLLADLLIRTPRINLEGDMSIKNPKTNLNDLFEHSSLSFNVSNGKFSSTIFPDFNYIKKGTEFSFSGDFHGDLKDINGDIELSYLSHSILKAKTQLSIKNQKLNQVIVRELNALLWKSDLKGLLSTDVYSHNIFSTLDWKNLRLEGKGAYLKGKEIESELTFIVDKSQLNLKTILDLESSQWRLNQEYVYSNLDVGKWLNNPNLNSISGQGVLEGTLDENQLNTLELNTQINSLGWNNISVNNALLKGLFSENSLKLDLAVADERLKTKMGFYMPNIKENNFILNGQLEELNLSSFGWTPAESEVRLMSEIKLVNESGVKMNIDFSNFSLINSQEQNQFSDFSLVYKQVNGLKEVFQEGSDFFDFFASGDFKFKEVSGLIQNSIEEALLIPATHKIDNNQYFQFDLVLRENLLRSLYPNVSTPNDVLLEGYLSSEKDKSTFRFDLPYIKYKGVTFESISLSTNTSSSEYLSQFSAKNITGSKFSFSSIFLTTKEVEKKLFGEISGDLGSGFNDTFTLGFTYDKRDNGSFFHINNTNVLLGGVQWDFSSFSRPTVFVANDARQIKLTDLKIESDQQQVELDLDFFSQDLFSFRLLTENLDLNKALPKGEKFVFGGNLTTNINVIRSNEGQSATASIAIADLEINQVNMGDFSLNISGNPQFNTYNLSSLLMKDKVKSMVGEGTIFVPKLEPNLNIDLTLNQFDLSFLAPLGKDKVTHSKGKMFATLNLWGVTSDLKLNGLGYINDGSIQIPSTNTVYAFKDNTRVLFRDRKIDFTNAKVVEINSNTEADLGGSLSHFNFSGWEMDVEMRSDHFLVYNRPKDLNALFYGKGYLAGKATFTGPTKSLTLRVEGSSSKGTTLVIPWQEDKGLSDTSFIDFLSKQDEKEEVVTANISSIDEEFRGFEMIFDLDINRNAEVEIVVDQSSGSTLSGRGSGNILVESNIDGKFNIWGDFIAYDGVYNFKNLSLVDKKFSVKEGGTIVWEGDPLEAQLNIEATYQVPGGANPALLVDNPNFNRKIPTNVTIQLVGNLLRPDDPVFDISFPNTTGILISEINYRLADQQRRQLQAISLLSQGIFISDVSVSLQGITNNLYEKASDMFSSILGTNENKLNVGLNYLQGEENATFDLRTEDRIGLTLSTQISDRILLNGKIGVPIDGLEETVIVGDVQIDFILNESGSLRAKVFNRENDFRYLGDEFGYTQGMGMSYQVDFNSFKDLILKISKERQNPSQTTINQLNTTSIEFLDKNN